MSETTTPIELLPKGQFYITKPDGKKIKGRFSMNVLDRFCEVKGIKNYLDLLEKITSGMTVGEYAEIILYAIHDYFRGNEQDCDYKTKADVSDLIDEVFEGGIADEKFNQLIAHAIGRVADIKKISAAVDGLTAEQQQKKSNG